MQGDDSKEGKDSKRLSRAELLEMLIEQSKEVELLKKKVDELQKQLDDRTIQLQQTGSIAEAALALNDIFKIETVEDFREFLKNNRNKLISHAIKVEKLPPDDEWIKDDSWDEVYEKEVRGNGKI